MKFNARKCKRKNNPRHLYRLGVSSLFCKAAFQAPEVLVDTKLNASHLRVLMAEAAHSILGWIRESIASGSREVIFPFYAAPVGLHLECCIQCWASC